MIVQYVSYVAALRLLFFGNHPASSTMAGAIPTGDHSAIRVYVYDPAATSEPVPAVNEAQSWALDIHSTYPEPAGWDMRTRQRARACGAFLRGAIARIVEKYPTDQVLVAGMSAATEAGDVADHFDPAMRLHLDTSTIPILNLPGAEAAAAAREWRDWSAKRTSQLMQIWRMDRDDGPHQPWARAKADFMLALAALGVRPPALELLPTWNIQWWYDAIGYEQRPGGPPAPRPTRCWSFPHFTYADAAPRVCGRMLATLEVTGLSDCGGAGHDECQARVLVGELAKARELTGDSGDRQTVTEKRRRARSELPTIAAMRDGTTRSMTPEDMDLASRSPTPETRALAAKIGAVGPYGDCLAPRERALVALLGHVGIGGTERVEILNRCLAAIDKHERAWKLAVADGDSKEVAEAVSSLAFDAGFLAYTLRRILAP